MFPRKMLCIVAFAVAGGLVSFAQDAGLETGIEDDLTVKGKGGSKTDPDLEVHGYAAFGTNYSGAVSVTSGVGNVYIQNKLEVGSNFFVSGVFQVDSLGNVALGNWNATTIGIGKGGTGQITADAAFNALAPSQAGNSGKFLTTDASTTSWAAPIPNAVNTITLTEEFCGGLNTAGNVGNLGWNVNTIGGAPTYSFRAGVTNHWGIFRITTSTTSGQGGTVALAGNTATALLAVTQPNTTIRLGAMIASAAVASETIRVGLADNPTGASPANGIYFECNGTNWFGVCRAGGVQSVTGSLLAADNTTWHRFQIRYNAANSVYFSVDGGAESQVTTNIPANGTGVQPSFRIITGAGAAKSIDMDYYQIILTGITR